MDQAEREDGGLERRIDGELRLVRAVILFVAGRKADRVVLAGLAIGAEQLDAVRRAALASGVRIVALRSPDETRVDLRVEAIIP